MSEAMIKIKNELGQDAVILSTRKIRQPGLFGIFKKSLTEVVAAIEEETAKKPKNDINNEELKKAFMEAREKVKNNEKSPEIEKINDEISTLKNMLEKLISEKDSPKKQEYTNEPRSNKVSTEKIREFSPDREHIEFLANILSEKDVTDDNIVKIVELLKATVDLNTIGRDKLTEVLQQKVIELLGTAYTIERESEQNKVFVFVGPTGVGKTTTLAKLAARLSLIENKKVGLITADTYRIAAVEQLKTYSEILGIPLTVVYDPEELDQAIDKYSNMDCILVDTAGRSHKSDELEKDIKNLLQNVSNPEIFLVISLTTGYKDIKSIVESYQFLNDYKLILTKLDETSTLGNILNVKMLTDKQLSYFTIGQSVPDDIEVAKAQKVASFIVGDN